MILKYHDLFMTGKPTAIFPDFLVLKLLLGEHIIYPAGNQTIWPGSLKYDEKKEPFQIYSIKLEIF